ncbi:hypothetical protein PO124_24630 [Bacillus licheniformis]|nr:hypothetical protein [Bacillus licheniformis]
MMKQLSLRNIKELEELSNNIEVPNKEEPESPSPGENDGTTEDNTSTDPVDTGQTGEMTTQ